MKLDKTRQYRVKRMGDNTKRAMKGWTYTLMWTNSKWRAFGSDSMTPVYGAAESNFHNPHYWQILTELPEESDPISDQLSEQFHQELENQPDNTEIPMSDLRIEDTTLINNVRATKHSTEELIALIVKENEFIASREALNITSKAIEAEIISSKAKIDRLVNIMDAQAAK